MPLDLQAEFFGDPGISPRGAGNDYAMLAPWTFRGVSAEGELVTLTVPAGFITDLASVPRLPLAYWAFGNRARRAAILHDWLYSEGWPRDWADSMFYAAALAEGVPKAAAYAMWLAVRVGGGAYYAKRTGPSNVNPETEREAP